MVTLVIIQKRYLQVTIQFCPHPASFSPLSSKTPIPFSWRSFALRSSSETNQMIQNKCCRGWSNLVTAGSYYTLLILQYHEGGSSRFSGFLYFLFLFFTSCLVQRRRGFILTHDLSKVVLHSKFDFFYYTSSTFSAYSNTHIHTPTTLYFSSLFDINK